MKTAKSAALSLFVSALSACSGRIGDPRVDADDDIGQARAEVRLAPTGAACLVIKVVVGTTTATRQFPLSPAKSTSFALDGLPLGNATFTASAFSVSCAQVTSTTKATWTSDPVTATVSATMTPQITFVMKEVGAGGRGNVAVEFPAARDGRVTKIPLPGAPFAMAVGSDGNFWVPLFGSSVARVTPTGAVTEFTGSVTSFSLGMAAGPDGNLWFTAPFASPPAVVRVTTTGDFASFPMPPAASGAAGVPFGIAAAPDGALWFTDLNASRILRITTAGHFSTFALPTVGAGAAGITAGPDGNMWFTEQIAGKIGRITPAGAITEFPLPNGGQPSSITTGPDGNLWVTDRDRDRILRATTAGVITSFTLPTSGAAPSSITAGPDGNVWFTEEAGQRIGRITPAGVITEYPLGGSISPTAITTGPDGALWFVDAQEGALLRITP